MTETKEIQSSPYSSGTSSQSAMAGNDEFVIDVRTLFRAFWRGKWIIVLGTLIGCFLGIQKMVNFTPKYQATVVVSPTENDSSTFSQSTGAQGLTNFAGLNQLFSGGKQKTTTFDRLRYSFGSISLIKQLVKKEDIIHVYHSGMWDAKRKAWIRPTGSAFEFKQKVKSFLNLPLWQPPTVESFAETLKSSIGIVETKDSPFFRLIYEHTNPEEAARFLTKMFNAADTYLRDQDKLASLEKKEYIERQLKLVSYSDHKMLLLAFLAQEEQRLMLLRSELPYSVKIIEPVFVSSSPTSPSILKDFGVSVVTWLLASIGIAVVFFLIKND